MLGNVEPADQCHLAICDDHLLVIADEVAGRAPRVEHRKTAACLDDRFEKGARRRGAETVNDQPHRHPALRRFGQRVTHLFADAVILEQVVIDMQRCPRLADDVDQRAQPILPARVEGQLVAMRREAEGVRIAIGHGSAVFHTLG